MTTLADKSLLSGGDNKPPMLEKHLYDSWKSRMELYMMNRPHGRMILASVEKGPLVWPTITVDGVTRPKKYTELTPAETIQADCDIKAINIILQGLPTKIYALVSQHRVAKDIWEKIKLLMQGTSLTKQERECKLYDEFDKFTYKKGESFLNTLPAEWSKFVTDVKLVKDLHTTNVDQIHAHLEQHERHANEVRLMHERNSDPLALYGSPFESQQYSVNQSSTPHLITYPPNNYQTSVHHNVYSLSSSIPQIEYSSTVNQQSEFSQLDSGLTIPVFKHGDDPIDAINHVMSFLSVVGRQISYAAGTTSTFTPGASGSNSGKQRIVTCYNYKGEGHMSKQCTKPRRKRDDLWFKDKVLLVQAQASGQILHEEELAFLADPGIPKDALAKVHNHDNVNNNMINQAVQVMPSSEQLNVVNHSETKLTSDSNIIPHSQYVIESQQAAVQNSNSSAQQDALILSLIEQLKTQVANCTKINLENKSVNDTLTAELERYKEQSVEIDHLKQTSLSEHLKEKESLMQMVTLLKNDFKKEESRNIDREMDLEKRIKQLDNIVFKRDQSAQTLEPKLYVGDIIEKTNAIVILDSEETLMLAEESHLKMLLKQKDPIMLEKKVNTTLVDYANSMNSAEPTLSSRPTNVEVPKELPKVSMVNTSLKKLKHHLAGFDVVVKERTTPTTITKVQNFFHQMEQTVEQHRLVSKTFEVKMNQVLNENERLLEQVISKDIVNILVNSSVNIASMNVHKCEKCLKLETELINKKGFIEKEIYDNLFKSFTTLEKHCISLEVDSQLNQEIFQRDNSVSNQSAPSFDQLFELNKLKAQSKEKDTVIKKLKERIKSLSGKMNEDKVKKDLEEIETINIELDHRVSKLIAENEHLKQTYKQLYDSIKPARIRSKEQCDDLINQVNLKSAEISDLNASLQEKVLVITALKDDLKKLKGKALVDNAVVG
ncbi:hypothetical protein Tco_1029435 [Tanacetum coccineum]|uniref:Integrase, catalytic region, zinc finger, CCHC-type, peptidase aspartic, catalytic n=1 Tax=Tanacetum coccineum TaxID=301880 RepID=A0ABQ5G3F1_9ASTR